MATQTGERPTSATPSLHDEKNGTESTSSTTDKNETTEVDQPAAAEREYLIGIKLILLLGAATLATFLTMLDMTIVATVCPPTAQCRIRS